MIIGLLAMLMMTILVNTSLQKVRRWSYRIFFLSHLVIGSFILPLLFFHAHPIRPYAVEALGLFIFDIICRKVDTVTGFATISSVPNTTLVKVTIPVSGSKIKRFNAAPGQHVYLQIPPESRPATASVFSIHEILYNPFTVASVSATDITLILRTLDGPTTQAIGILAHLTKAKPPINVEGPLGSSSKFLNLTGQYDRILLIAGGVGATFVLPIYRYLHEQLNEDGKSTDRVKLIWSMRDLAEASWAYEEDEEEVAKRDQDENVKIFVTGKKNDSMREEIPSGNVEMDGLLWKTDDARVTGGYKRPNLGKIVDETFRVGNEERVAVIVCGPRRMAREVRKTVGRWAVEKGREAWFHNESFGW